MPRKLKTYVTTSGFFELAVAAPSMKAALEIWGSKSNLFQTGFAKEVDDPDIVKAAMAHPGTVLRRAVGTNGAFKEDAEAPKLAALGKAGANKPLPVLIKKKQKAEAVKKAASPAGDSQKAAQLYDLAQKRREREELRLEAERQKARERREQAIEKAQAALAAAREKYEDRIAEFDAQQAALTRKVRLEKDRWDEEKSKLEAALKRARE
jgi:hypothetical protein